MMTEFFKAFKANTNAGPDYLTGDQLIDTPPADHPIRFLAYYLPQFHAIAENDTWWGKGFTEWTNVTKALPRYDGHIQPRLPADLGFYDLTELDTIRKQAALARRGGIAGFCIHDYWFSGRKVLERPLNLILENPDIDLPFCLNWANESWSRRWDGSDKDILIEQKNDPADLNGYIRSILPALRDPRYITVDGRPLIMVYRPDIIPDAHRMMDSWREFTVSEGMAEPYLVMAQTFGQRDPRSVGMDAAAGFPPHGFDIWAVNDRDYRHLFDLKFGGQVRSYVDLADEMLGTFSSEYVTLPAVCPGWDNEARMPGHGVSFYGSTPKRYAAWLANAAAQVVQSNTPGERIVFINAWNEWAEGAILEPDRHFGHAYLNATRTVLDDIAGGQDTQIPVIEKNAPLSKRTRVGNGVRRKMTKAIRSFGRR